MTLSHKICSLTLPNRLSSLLVAERVVESVCLQAKSSDKDTSAIVLAMSEALCNIIQYGFDTQDEQEISLDISLVGSLLTIQINDEGIAVPNNIVNQYHEGRVCLPSLDVDIQDLPDSGWGVNILLMTAKNVRYTRTSTGNQLELEFLIS